MATSEEPSLVPQVTRRLVLQELIKSGTSIVMVYSIHYGTAKGYNLVCVPGGVMGYFVGFITTASPWCRFMLEIMKMTENQYSTLILLILSRIVMQAIGV